MGIVNFGIPRDFVLRCRDQFNIRAFVETGTFRGDTAEFAAQFFGIVHTVEFVAGRFTAARQRFQNRPNVTCHHGNSPDALKAVAPALAGVPTMYWLDAHWNGDGEARDFECPVMDEVSAINASGVDAYILVDDARYFLAPPPRPHDAAQWPSMTELVPVLSDSGRRWVTVFDDVIVAFPTSAKGFLTEWARNRPRAWEAPKAPQGGVFYIRRDELPPSTLR